MFCVVFLVCLLHCSGRGQCDPVTKSCACDPLWMENPFQRLLEDGESNCGERIHTQTFILHSWSEASGYPDILGFTEQSYFCYLVLGSQAKGLVDIITSISVFFVCFQTLFGRWCQWRINVKVKYVFMPSLLSPPEWNVLYVVLTVFLGSVLILSVSWTCFCCCKRYRWPSYDLLPWR